MPAPKFTHKLVMKPTALGKMAAAFGEEAMRGGRGGQPNKKILVGQNKTGTGSKLVSGESDPSRAFATIVSRYAAAMGGINKWAAADELFDIVEITVAEQNSQAAA